MCLNLLHEWISDKYIPNYFIPEENMFVKMEAALKGNYDKLKSCVAKMRDDWRGLFRTTFDDFGKDFVAENNVIRRMPICVVIDKYLKEAFSSDCSEYIGEIANTLDYIAVVKAVLESSQTSAESATFEENIIKLYKQWFVGHTLTLDSPERFEQLIKLFQFAVKDSEMHPRTFAVMVLKSGFQVALGSVLAARYFQTGNKQYLMKANTYLVQGASFGSMYGMLIKATVLTKLSLFDASISILSAAELANKDSPFQYICYENKAMHEVAGLRKENQAWGKSAFPNPEDINCFVCMSCLYFKCCEYDILPITLAFEAYRSVGMPTYSLSAHEEFFVNSVVVDPVMYLYYMQFLNNPHNPGEAAVALHKFETTLFERLGRSDWPGHIDTWLNVLGDIYVKKGWTALALRGFKLSDKVLPRHNAVRWHVMFLLLNCSQSERANLLSRERNMINFTFIPIPCNFHV